MQVRRPPERLLHLAHRGASGAFPENTHAAFAAALDLGVDGIELDCQLSADGELVVIHDEILDRTTSGLGPVLAKTWNQLAALDAGTWKDARFRGERIPRLLDVIDQVDGRAVVNVEIKSRHDLGRIESVLANEPRIRAAADWLLFSSFHDAAIRNLRAAAPWATIGILVGGGDAQGALRLAAEVGAVTLHPSLRLVDAGVVARAHEAGLGVWVWTVNAPRDVQRVTGFRVDAIFTDVPERHAPARAP